MFDIENEIDMQDLFNSLNLETCENPHLKSPQF
jgi:hypothetical protein